MSILQFISKGTTKCLSFYNLVGVVIILSQINNAINISPSKDSNADYYVSVVLKRIKKQSVNTNCQIPNYGLHASYAILGESQNKYYQPGDNVQQFNNLEIRCKRGYKPTPFSDKRAICIGGTWQPLLTINCLRTCPSLNSTISTRVTCKYHDIPLENCNDPVEGTTAFLSCNPLYEEDDLQKNRIRLCRAGRWIPSISECYPKCGEKRPKGRPNIVNGQNATLGDYPWQVGIYNARKELICGGSILDRHIIMTAAHCVTEYYGGVNPVENYSVAAGKYYRKYDDDKDALSQYSKVDHIHVPERYSGGLNNYDLDIAILILTDPFTISEGVQPVCIELNEESPYLHLSSNSNGIVTGWGYTLGGGELSEVLKELEIPYIPYRRCFEEVPNNFRKYITSDKICGGYLNSGAAVCGGDSGGALVFENMLSQRYYVKGIVSTSPATEALVCDTNQYSLYTSVRHHVDFIRNHLAYNQIEQSMEFTSEDFSNEETDESKPEIDTCSREHYISEMLRQNDSAPPQIIPKGHELTINVSLTLELRCLSKNFVTWTAPNTIFTENDLAEYSTNITIKSSKCDSVYESLLTINNVSYSDVGFYHCHENTTDLSDFTKTNNIYVYVYDNEKLFIMPESRLIRASEDSKVILPCRPTSPDIDVKLTGPNDEVVLNNENSYVTYNSKIGFINYKVAEVGNYTFKCKFSRGRHAQVAFLQLLVEAFTQSIPKPVLQKISTGHTTIGQKLTLKCTYTYFGPFAMSWDVPNKIGVESGRIKYGELTRTKNVYQEYFQDLIIENTTIADQGEYTCIVRSIQHVNKDTMYILFLV